MCIQGALDFENRIRYILESYSQLPIFGPNAPNKAGNRVPHTFFVNLFYSKIFTILSWFCIQRALGFENRIRYTWKFLSVFNFWSKCPKKGNREPCPFFWNYCFMLKVLQSSHGSPTSPWFWKLDQFLQFSHDSASMSPWLWYNWIRPSQVTEF